MVTPQAINTNINAKVNSTLSEPDFIDSIKLIGETLMVSSIFMFKGLGGIMLRYWHYHKQIRANCALLNVIFG
ncbi:hypothetical protein J2X29_000282 [Shewanella putrefaciens]|nr:hypothetical protein [Shewanella putrefaciens]